MLKERGPTELSFVVLASTNPRILDLWHVEPIEDWSAGNARGRDIADECLTYMKERESPMFLGHVAQAIASKNRFGSVEVGFFHRIAECAMTSID